MVADDPDIIFEIQEINTGTFIPITDIGLNVNLKVGTNNGFVSGWTVDNTTQAVGATLQLKMLQLVQRSDSAPGLAQRWLVVINNHEFSAGTVGYA
jgi:hypothetical protein